MEKEPTILIGTDGIEYVINGGKLYEKCQHKTITDESTNLRIRKVCHDCAKVIDDYRIGRNSENSFNPIEQFRAVHGREPRGLEISGLM